MGNIYDGNIENRHKAMAIFMGTYAKYIYRQEEEQIRTISQQQAAA